MREAMAGASVGDDVYGEDPTVNQLEKLAAELVGKDEGLFVASGTMGNITAILSHTTHGDEAIVGHDSHVMRAEGGGMSRLGGVMPKPLLTDDLGRMSLEQIVKAVSPDDPHYPITRLILVENTYGKKNGYPLPPEYFAEVYDIAQDHGLSVHMDGARLFNAAVALNVDVKTITQSVDSVMFCLSKGLCAPVGSILCGSSPFIKRARRERKVLGGAMRQAGILAAAGLVALNEMIERLATDHANANKIATGLARIPGVDVDPDLVLTNIVFFDLNNDVDLTAEAVVGMMRDRANIWLGVDDEKRMRIVTHYWVGEAEIKLLLDQLEAILTDRRLS